jgi:hypothetical protein
MTGDPGNPDSSTPVRPRFGRPAAGGARIALGVALLIASLGVLATVSAVLAGRGPAKGREELADDNQFGRDSSAQYWQRAQLPQAFPRTAGLSPFGDQTIGYRGPMNRPGLVATGIGYVDLKDARTIENSVPPGLRRKAEAGLPGGTGGLSSGVNLVQVRADAIATMGPAGVEHALAAHGRVLGLAPERAWIVRLQGPEAARALAREPWVEAAAPYHGGLKIDVNLGRTPFIEKKRAESRTLRLQVLGWNALDAGELADLRRAVERVTGPGTTHSDGDGRLLIVEAQPEDVARLAAIDEVEGVAEEPEMMLSNSEAPSVVMVGSVEDTLGARPYADIGLDGGGIDTNGDGTRVNDGTDAVPPQIVAITDNGLSFDTPNFSQTATQTTAGLIVVGPKHRKIQAMQSVTDSGDDCDGILSGSGSHGNVVAATIAAWPSALGFYATKTTLPRNPAVSGIVMDGVARGARIIMQDAANATRCTIDELIEQGGNVTPGNVMARLTTARDGGSNVHLQVLPFGVPNFDNVLDNIQNGVYSMEASQIDAFLVNNRDYMIFSPVGNGGTSPKNLTQRRIPDLFDGTALDNDPNFPSMNQIAPPATAKDSITVGSHRTDMQTFAGTFNEEEVSSPWGSRGPATPASLRTAPILTSVGEDFNGVFGAPGLGGVAVFRSKDNDNLAPIEAELDELNFGTSYASGYATGAGAIVRDYFAQGFYPSGNRTTADRMPNVSGALVKAALVAGANFLEENGVVFPTTADRTVAQSRAGNIGTVGGINVGVIGNNEQGYGRIQLSTVLPIPSWPASLGIGAPDTIEYPAAGLLIWDDIGTAEPPIDNAAHTFVEHLFTVDAPTTVVVTGGGRAVSIGALRVALAWPDPPGAALGDGTLINDLDLEVESPGPDNNLATTADNVTYDGNVYVMGQGPRLGQWSVTRISGGLDLGDKRNPIEAIHISADPNGDGNPQDSQLYTGTWRVRVKRGSGGATPGVITKIDAPSEDVNGNYRLDTGEDLDADGLLDAGGQPFGLVAAGPVLGTETQSWAGGPHLRPTARTTLDKPSYGCSDDVVVKIYDPAASLANLDAATTLSVQDALGNVVDTERSFAFSEIPPGSHGFVSAKVPVRMAQPSGVADNGILEGDTGRFIVVDYAGTPVAGQARAVMNCDPNLFAGVLQVRDQIDAPSVFTGGCDHDQYPDSGEVLTYTVALLNANRGDNYAEVIGTLVTSGPGANAVKVLDSPKRIGFLPGGQTMGITFSLFVDPTALNAVPIASRQVTLTLTLDSTQRSKLIGRQSFSFTHALNSDREVFHYSTDFPGGGREVRDLNRNLRIDAPDKIDPFAGVQVPDEDIVFSSLWYSDGGVVRNTLGEDLNANGTRETGETDVIPNGILDKGILANPSGPDPADKVPFNFDTSSDGFTPLRHPNSEVGQGGIGVVWEYSTLGLCGFQTAIPDGDGTALFQNAGAGIWHTGDGDTFTPDTTSTACDSYFMPNNAGTPVQSEFLFDVLESPIIAKVHQIADVRGFPYTVEFQRLALNLNHQTIDSYAGGNINLDNDIDNDARNCLLCQPFYARFGGEYYGVARFNTYSYGVNPLGKGEVKQRTFGPRIDPNNSIAGSGTVTGDELGFSGFTQNNDPNSTNPIPTAPPDLLPYPVPGGPLPLASDGTPASNSVAGPTRNFELTLVNYQDGLVYFPTGAGAFEPGGFFNPGPTANRWAFGIGFFVIESSSLQNDYGLGVDDPVLEWDEYHPVDESQFVPAHTPACQRFGQPGQPAGQQCATLVVDRTNLYQCDEALAVTVNDPKRAGQGTVQVKAASDSDGVLVTSGLVSVVTPAKSFTLTETTPGLFKGTITVTSQINNAGSLFVTPATDESLSVYYVDPLCDGDGDGQANESDFANLDGDGIAAGVDKCPLVYDPAQADADGDGVGDLCDNCPNLSNATQIDSDADGVGDACEFDDVDADGVANDLDNCPDVYNPSQAPGSSQNRGAACSQLTDRDGDGIVDNSDNCVRTPNATQVNSDGDRLGNACDGDCTGAVVTTASTGVCARTNTTLCTGNGNCPTTGLCSITIGTVCTSSANCPVGETCTGIAQETCVKTTVTNSGTCGTIPDDLDQDLVPDSLDNCPTISNPAVVAGTFRQLDTDQDGLGDACDPNGTFDDDRNGVPDDLAQFRTVVSCRALPLARVVVRSVAAGDVDGDRDGFIDAGERGRIYLQVTNTGTFDLTNVSFNLNTTDPDVNCITVPSIRRAVFHAGETLTLGSIGADKKAGTADDSGDYFELAAKSTMTTTTGSSPATIDLVLTLTSSEVLGTAQKVPIRLVADLDLPAGAVQTKTLGPDNIAGTADDGMVFENFETERDGFSGIQISHTPLGVAGAHNDTIGFTVGTGDGGLGAFSVVGCGGFHVPPLDPGCKIDPDNDMGWHIHCPGGTCPNTSLFTTPPDGALALSGTNSLHWGHHINPASRSGDTTRFRQMAAFVTNPINLAVFPDPGDLQLSFYHIADMVTISDLNRFGRRAASHGPPTGAARSVEDDEAFDYGDVQIQVDTNPTPGTDVWGFWDKLVPYENVYDHTPQVWSRFGTSLTYCNLTPSDTGNAPPAPRGVHETMCWPQGVWASCGWPYDLTTTQGCPGPGVAGTTGTGNWVQTKFDLQAYLGQRVRIRWMGQGWEFNNAASSYQELGGTWAELQTDDGWWIDDIRITGAITTQITPSPDTKTPFAGTCPATCNSGVGDGGTTPAIAIRDANGDGVYETGEALTIDGSASTLPGGCVGGVAQYRFERDGALIQDWSTASVYIDSPLKDTSYKVKVRCSANVACASVTGATVAAQIYTGDGNDIVLNLTTGVPNTTGVLTWAARPQVTSVGGYDVFRGLLIAFNSDPTLSTLQCVATDIPQPAVGAPVSFQDPAIPPLKDAYFYFVGHSSRAAGAHDALGRRSNNAIIVSPVSCP